ncbi:tensin-2-like [Sinocyclocheilus rhinocerous]|uniref:tensin-2-like n=1 Tax=Sinocyclocheilus rhinocerous TaxID=307959 RepID=UPI0007B8224B|nr:PREDICTED: tensin-2-like [Sinocyclocheilus rhinocerous]
MGSHSFKERNFKKKHHCVVCRQALDSHGMYCRECKTAVHKKCEEKVSVPCEVISDAPPFQNQMNIPPSRDKMESVMEKLMGSHYDFDLTYITERIISVLYLSDLEDQRYSANLKEVAAMLKSKHPDKFLLINLSEKRHDICRLNPKEFGWPDLHAPSLNKICAVCKTMENWLNSDPQNVVVLHCKGNKGKKGVIVAAYMHYSKISAGADQALSTVAMRKFCEDKISSSLQPSQNRYIYYFAGLLSGSIKMNSSPLFLHQIHIPALLNHQSGGSYSPFVKIYQSLQLVYTSGKYDIQGPNSKTLCVNIEPALLLKGDILVKCYHHLSDVSKRECVFRVQFHTCSVHGSQLDFGKGELDHACTDDRFPADATVELLFSSGSQRRGGEVQGNEPGVSVDYGTADPIVRWDSYENFNIHHEDSVEDICHTRGPLDGSLYAQVKKCRAPGSSPSGWSTSVKTSTHSPSHSSSTPIHLSFQPLSLSKDASRSSAPPESPFPLLREKREKDEDRERHRETAILDDGDCSPMRPVQSCYGHPYSHTHSFCDPELTNPHALAQTLHPKHHTLPCSRTAPVPVRDSCVSQPDLLWERGQCLHHPCPETVRHMYSYPTHETHLHSPLSHSQSSHSHTLPAQTRAFYSGEACPVFHCSALPQGHAHIPFSLSPTQSLLSSSYRELRYSMTLPTSCSCRDCSRLREDVALHSLRGREIEALPWSRETEFGIRREGPVHWRDERAESHWEGAQEAEYWRRKIAMSPVTLSYRHCHAVPKQDQAIYVTDTQPEHITPISPYPSPQSSGYHSPRPPCPCSPQPFRESPGYASISHSLNSSPIALTPSPKRASYKNAAAEESQHSMNDGRIEVLDADKSHIEALSPPSSPMELGEPMKSKVLESRTFPGSLITVVSAISGAEENTKKTPITDSTSNTTLISNPPSSKVVESVQVQTHNPKPLNTSILESEQDKVECPGSCYTSTSPQPPLWSSERSSASEFPSFNINAERQSLTTLTDHNEESSNSDLTASSPDPDGYITPSFPIASYSYPLLTVHHVPYTGYTEITIPASLPQPPLPEKQHSSPLQNVSECTGASSIKSAGKPLTSSAQFHVSFSTTTNELPPTSKCKVTPSSGMVEPEIRLSSKFVQDSSKYWYHPGISRDQDGRIEVLDADKSHIEALSPPSSPMELGEPMKSKVLESRTFPGSLITVVSAISGAEENTKKTPITDSTSNTTLISNPPSSKVVESVQVQTHNPKPLNTSILESEQDKVECPGSCYTSTSPQPPLCSSERSSASEFPSFNINAERQSLTTLTDHNEESSNSDLTASSPDPDGYITPSFPIASYSYPLLTVHHVPYTGYTEITIPASLPQPPLPEKQHSSPLQNVSECTGASSIKSAGKPLTSSAQFHVSFSTTTNELPPTSKCKVTPSSGMVEPEIRLSSKFVQDSSKYWYHPGISRDQAITVLKDKEPGCFLIRDSNSFQGAYGLALKVSTPPAHASNHGETGNPQEQLVTHFLIESGPKGVKIKGCQNETYFGSLSALVYQHSITPVSLPCVLRIPDRDLVGELQELQNGTNTSTAADLLKQGAACNVLYLNSVETESLTGPQAVSKATKCTLTQDPRPSPTVVHFKVSTQGITLTDNQRRLFFRRHYPIHSVTFSSVDPLDQRWIDADNTSRKMFGFVARRSGGLGNVCHLFAELDPEQPATAIVNFINKVMLGPQQLRK